MEVFTFSLKVFAQWIDNGAAAPAPLYTNLLRKNIDVNALPH